MRFFLVFLTVITMLSAQGYHSGHQRARVFSSPQGRPAGNYQTGYTPKQIREAYGFDRIPGSGTNQIVAVVVGYGSPTIHEDLRVFNHEFHVPEAHLTVIYASQAILSGGAPFVGFGNVDSYSWWYDKHGTTANVMDDGWSDQWSNAERHHDFFTTGGWGADVADGSTLSTGDLVYYNWSGGSSIEHVAIVVVGASGGSTPLVDSHNDDYWHVKWNYGKTARRWPVHLNDTLYN